MVYLVLLSGLLVISMGFVLVVSKFQGIALVLGGIEPYFCLQRTSIIDGKKGRW